MPWLTPLWDGDPELARDLARATDGRTLYNGGSTIGDVKAILDTYRVRYVLRYVPRGVNPTGWHEIEVRVIKPGRFVVEARKGYSGG